MRTRTFVLSLVLHVLLVGGFMVTRIMAATELPDPPRAITFMIVRPELPAVPPPPARANPSPTPAVNPNAAPVEEPEFLRPELPDRADDSLFRADVVFGAGGDDIGAIPDAPPPPPATRVESPQPMRVGGIIRQPQKIHHVAPIYPEIARSARVSGIVILEAVLAEDGTVRDVRVLRSVPLLDAAALAAVREWRFTPTLLNGTPVAVVMTVTVAFNLN
jgi:periplasmic protein TonB